MNTLYLTYFFGVNPASVAKIFVGEQVQVVAARTKILKLNHKYFIYIFLVYLSVQRYTSLFVIILTKQKK